LTTLTELAILNNISINGDFMGLLTTILVLSAIVGLFYMTTKIIEKDNEKFEKL
jgi:hypothetical protein